MKIPDFGFREVDDEQEMLEILERRVGAVKSNGEYKLLYECAVEAPPGDIVELGSLRGVSTVIIACALAFHDNKGRLIAVDWAKANYPMIYEQSHFINNAEGGPARLVAFIENLLKMGIDDLVIPVLCSSSEAAEILNVIPAMVFVDANHSYEDCSEDIRLWGEKLQIGGLMALHDYRPDIPNDGVSRAIHELLILPAWKEHKRVGTMIVYEKCEECKPQIEAQTIAEQPTLKVGIIGTGMAGDLHADAFQHVDNAEVVAGVDINQEALSAWGKKYNINSLWQTYTDMITEVEPDVVSICTWVNTHVAMVKEICNHGNVKGIICEKPMALTIADCDEMIGCCEQHNIKLIINHQRRFNKNHCDTKLRIDVGEIGELQKVWVNSWEDFFDYGVHFVDLLRYYLGDAEFVLGSVEWRNETSSKGHELENGVAGLIKFRSGVTAVIESISHTGDFHFIGTNGYITTPLDVHPMANAPFVESLQLAINTVLGIDNHPVTGIVGRAAMEILLAIYESSRIGAKVYLQSTNIPQDG